MGTIDPPWGIILVLVTGLAPEEPLKDPYPNGLKGQVKLSWTIEGFASRVFVNAGLKNGRRGGVGWNLYLVSPVWRN